MFKELDRFWLMSWNHLSIVEIIRDRYSDAGGVERSCGQSLTQIARATRAGPTSASRRPPLAQP